MRRLLENLGPFGIAGALLLWLVLGLGGAARANTLPASANLQFQTSSRERIPGIGDWYTTRTSASTDRVHRILIEVSQELLDANGGNVNVQVFDAECNGALDEVTGTPDPARFELRASNGVSLNPGANGAFGRGQQHDTQFSITAVGIYQLVVVNGAYPINNDAAVTLNDDDNTYSVSIPGNTTLIGQFQGTFSPTAAVTALNFYFLVGPGQANLRLRNFDLDSSPTVSYTRPSGATIAGTTSNNGVWNNGGSLDVGEDTVTVSSGDPYPDAGQWGLTVGNVGASNQFALEANAGTSRLVLFDQPAGTADAGNFSITPDGTLPGAIGTPTDHFFSITNFFFTTDIINLSLANTGPNYTVQLFDAATNTLLVDGDSDGRVDTGILQPNQTKSYYLRVTPQPGAATSDTTRINATSLMDARVVPGVITTEFVNKTTQITNVTNVTGTVYNDLNHNSILDASETGLPTTGFFVKLVPTAGGNAIIAAAVNSANGTYQILNVAPGTYNLVLDNNSTLTDTTPALPPNTSGTEAPLGIRAVTVPKAGAVDQNFGRYSGAVLTGRVFRDDGTGGGTANDGVLNGGEIGISGVIVRSQNSAGGVTYDTATTDTSGNYRLYAPAAGAAIRIAETNLSSFRSTGGTPGTSGGTYSLASDATTLTPAAGTTYTNINFGDVPPSVFTEDNVRVAAPGETVVMPHIFTAGTAGNLSFDLSAVSNPATGWSNLLYRDTNGDGVLQPGEPQITAPIAVTAGQQIAVLTKVFTPLGAPVNSQQTLQIAASLTYANQPSLIETITHNDLVTLSSNSGLELVKSVNRTTASKGDDIIYTIAFRNTGNAALGNIVINDTTPTFTVFRSATTGTLPPNLGAPVTTFPTVGTAGALKWAFTGTLAAGRSGQVTFTVRLQ